MMSEKQFDDRIKAIEAGYAKHREGADAFRDQELARLFVECGWTQEMIAQKMGKTQQWVALRLVFGRFIRFTTDRCNLESLPKHVTEWRFRQNWSAAGKGHKKETEQERFARVLELLRADTREVPKGYGNLVHKPGIKAAVTEVLADGKRRTTAEIAEVVSHTIPETTTSQVGQALKQLQRKPPKGMALDARHSGRSHKYRLVPRKGPVPAPSVNPDEAGVVAAEALPLIEECIDILRKPIVGRQTTLALDHLWKVEQMLKALLVPEEVV